jgi:hypothetical protein
VVELLREEPFEDDEGNLLPESVLAQSFQSLAHFAPYGLYFIYRLEGWQEEDGFVMGVLTLDPLLETDDDSFPEDSGPD